MTHFEQIKQIARHYGFRHQAIKASEECSELSAAFCKLVDGEAGRSAVIEEMADVTIMLRQMRYLMRVGRPELDRVIDFKVSRQMERIKSEKSIDKSEKSSIMKNHQNVEQLLQKIAWYQELYDRSRIENKPGACF